MVGASACSALASEAEPHLMIRMVGIPGVLEEPNNNQSKTSAHLKGRASGESQGSDNGV
jgi:hypothetical protein